jgi:hypothetical protein
MINANKQKWIVHPHSYAEVGYRSISVIHESYTHGLRSYGWYNSDKKLIAYDSMYGSLEDGAYDLLIKYAEGMAKKLNSDNVQPNPEVLAETVAQEENNRKMGERFANDIEKAITKVFGEKL